MRLWWRTRRTCFGICGYFGGSFVSLSLWGKYISKSKNTRIDKKKNKRTRRVLASTNSAKLPTTCAKHINVSKPLLFFCELIFLFSHGLWYLRLLVELLSVIFSSFDGKKFTCWCDGLWGQSIQESRKCVWALSELDLWLKKPEC